MEKRRIRKNRRAIIVLFIIAIALITASFVLFLFKPVEVKKFDVMFKVDRSITAGFDVGTDALRFGSLSPGSGAKRNVDVVNNYDFPLKVKVLVSKNLVGLVNSGSDFAVQPGENISIPVTLNIPADFEDGNYTGEIKFEMYKLRE